LWASAGLLGMFLFSLAVLLLVYFFFLGKSGFEVVVKSVPAGSDVLVDGSFWGITDSDGTIRLKTLRAGQTKKIEIKSQSAKCEIIEIKAEDAKNGGVLQENARCERSGNVTTNNPPNLPKECQDIKDLETSRNCANTELDKLEAGEKNGQKFTIEQLLYAMNLYIINFDPNKAIIRNERDLKFIERAAGFMKRLPPNIVIEIGGHTDSDGTDANNQPLSENRATAVRNALVKYGINSIMLQTKGYGSKQPVASNDTAVGKFKNRRIKYTVISK
jgi:outer membrane protein OmpA-like peptidoglycan-associated protein